MIYNLCSFIKSNTETVPYDGRLSPDNLVQEEDEIDIGGEDEPRINNMNSTSRSRYEDSNYEWNSNKKNAERPKTGRKSRYNVDSSYYLDDPNY